jgi:uncharacterized SAM-binding protein YcdF (DUF218 family)
MFLLKKLMPLLILPPGLFILLLLLSGIWMLLRKVKFGILNLLLAALFYGMSISPVANNLIGGLENYYPLPGEIHGDVLVLLGGGVNTGVPDFSGTSFPGGEMLARMVTAIRIHRVTGMAIIVSGGRPLECGDPEAPVVKRVLMDLGVPDSKIIVEDKSRDTFENAKFVKEICGRSGYRNPILVTSACHMERAMMTFKKAGLAVTAYPANFMADHKRCRDWADYLPNFGNLAKSAAAIREYLGILFYKLAY